MPRRYAELMFTPHVKAAQEKHHSRAAYARFESPDRPAEDRLGEVEAAFIEDRNSFYMASVTETGWPYVQHRGGPTSFLKVLDDHTIGFADYRGNKQYVSVGNFATNDRVALFLMDYPNKLRLKMLGRARIVDEASDPALLARLSDDYPAKIERGVVITVEGFDWNCNQHITPRFTEAEIVAMLAPVRARMTELEEENARLRAEVRAMTVAPTSR